MNDILLEGSQPALVKALEINLHAHVPLLGRMPETAFWQEPGFLAVLTRLDPSENYVYLARFAPEEVEMKIAHVLQRNLTLGSQPLFWQVGPSTTPADFGQHLLKCGFSFTAGVPGMAVDLREMEQPSLASSEFRVVPVRSEDQLRQWLNILAKVDGFSDALKEGFYQVFTGLGLSTDVESQLFLGLENGRVVATSRLFCAGGVAGIWHVATSPEARGKGYGTAMTLAAAHAGRECGYRFGVLYATPAGLGIYHQLGFREYCHIDVYQSLQ